MKPILTFLLFLLPLCTRAVDVQIKLDFSPLSTGMLTNAGLPSAMTFADLSESDPVFVYHGGGADFTHTHIVADQGSSPAFPFDVTLNGSTTRPVGTKWLYFDLSEGEAADMESLWLTYHGGLDEHWHNVIQAGFIKIDFGAPPAGNINFDLMETNGPFSILQLGLRPDGNHIWYSHAQKANSASDNGPTFAATDGVFFYQFFRDTTNSRHRVRFYDPSNNYAVVGESDSELGNNVWSYRTYFQNWYNGSQPAQNVEVWFGPTVFIYDPTDFVPMGGSATVGTLTIGTLNVGN